MKKQFLLFLWFFLSCSSLAISGCWLEPNYKNCRDAIKSSWLLFNPDVATFYTKYWYIKEYPAKIMVWTNIWHVDPDVPWWAAVACIASTNGKLADNWWYKYEAVFILWKDPTLTQREIIKYKDFVEEYLWDGLRYKYLWSDTELSQEQIDAIMNFSL